ncbi:MAG: hypothetical protein AB7F89_14620 [Pirellulaceae bacterium]
MIRNQVIRCALTFAVLLPACSVSYGQLFDGFAESIGQAGRDLDRALNPIRADSDLRQLGRNVDRARLDAIHRLDPVTTIQPAEVAGGLWKHASGEFRREDNGNWREFSKGQPTFRFRETGRNGSTVMLFDQARKISVQLSYQLAIVSQQGRETFKLPGGWHWQEWMKSDRKSAFVEVSPGRWAEFQGGQEAFQFQEVYRSASQVALLDRKRDITVHLEGPKARVLRGNAQLFALDGQWSR